MTQETQAGGETSAREDELDRERAFLVVYPEGDGASRVLELPEGVEVTFGRSRGCTVLVDTEKVSRQHARVVRRGADIVVEDLGSRNGTRVNGVRIEGPTRVTSGDEVGVGPLVALVGVTTPLRRRMVVGAASYLDERLAAEVDRATRYHRPLGLVALRLQGPGIDAALDRIAGILRRMDCLAEYAPDEYVVILPEADRAATESTARRIAAEGRALGDIEIRLGVAAVPGAGQGPGDLLGRARAALRRARLGGGTDGIAGAPDEEPPAREDRVVLDPQMRRLYELCAKLADKPITVLVLGETGAGKELLAAELHARSSRAGKPFVKLNCAALVETLLESELFGHERGAFTGADRRKVGWFEAASGGVIFLDEIGEMPLSLQAKLLRVLETRKITRLGGTAEVDVDVRVVCATNRDLAREVQRGRFREDLYFRVGGFVLLVPPLRDRRSEIIPLAEHFVRGFARELGQSAPPLSAEARAALEAHPWPGNVRELKNAMERAVALVSSGPIELEHLPAPILDARPGAPEGSGGEVLDVREKLNDVERATIVAALAACGGNQTRAAQSLRLSRRALIYKMEKYGLKPPPGR
jgi:DNA-binding NtrC family response regulator